MIGHLALFWCVCMCVCVQLFPTSQKRTTNVTSGTGSMGRGRGGRGTFSPAPPNQETKNKLDKIIQNTNFRSHKIDQKQTTWKGLLSDN